MSAATVLSWRAGAALFMAAALWFGAAGAAKQEAKPEAKPEAAQEAKPEAKPEARPEAKPETKKEGSEKKTEPETREFRLTVVVVAGEPAAPVNRANVTVFYGDSSRPAPTGNDGRAAFIFTTAAKTATVRVIADKFDPYQSEVSLGSGQIEHHAVLTKSR